MHRYRNRKIFAGILTLTLLQAGTALAGSPTATVPAPGILGLVALGVVGAIVVARYRK